LLAKPRARYQYNYRTVAIDMSACAVTGRSTVRAQPSDQASGDTDMFGAIVAAWGSRGLKKAVGFAVSASLLLGASSASAEEYRLGSQDKVRISIVEWTLDDLQSPINGEFVVSASGMVSLPLLGEVPAAGMATTQLARQVSEKLKAKLALKNLPNASVEVIAFRPFYILGDVERSGEYAFRPGLTVLQGLSLAGGFPRQATPRLQIERESLTVNSELEAAHAAIDATSARASRLEAELAGSEVVAFAPDLMARKDEPAVANMMRAETLVFEARRMSRASQDAAQARIADLVAQEIASLADHVAALQRQQDAVEKQLAVVTALREKGLGSAGRDLDLERILAEIQSKQREVESRALGVQQQDARTSDALHQAENQRQIDITAELQQVRTERGRLLRQQADAEKLAGMVERGMAADPKPAYVIVRADSQGPGGREISADEFTALQPGDVLKVRLGVTAPASMVNDRVADAKIAVAPLADATQAE
jgi:polysaccharide biosynthesis/export protein ExoF